ncbi:MAG: DUF2975 domain-containing protein [Clostridia bacterium]|nr:DUF2975 domain-containing protein [Clostridia bacterium]
MKQKALATWIRVALALLGVIGAVVYILIIPTFGLDLRDSYPEFSGRFYPWLIFLLSTALPCYAILVLGWLIAGNIGRDQSFSQKNARYLKWIAGIAAGLSLYFFIGNLVLLFLDMSHPGIVIGAMLFVLAGIAVTLAAAALSRLVTKAAVLQDENDLTV